MQISHPTPLYFKMSMDYSQYLIKYKYHIVINLNCLRDAENIFICSTSAQFYIVLLDGKVAWRVKFLPHKQEGLSLDF